MASKRQDESCPICLREVTEKLSKHICLHDGLSCCQECLVEWFVTKIKEKYHSGPDLQVSCIFSDCQGTLRLQKIFSQLRIEHQSRINEELLQAYLNSQQDVRRCPKKDCLYAGTISLEPCGKDLECELCSTMWTDKIHQTTPQKALNFFRSIIFAKNEILSQLWKLVFSKKCPDCKSAIVKNNGCDHITCLKCGAQFCWRCPSRVPAHDMTIHYFYMICMSIIWLVFGFSIVLLFACLIPSLRFILYETIIEIWTWMSWMIDWIYWGVWLLRDFFILNSTMFGLQNILRPARPDWRFRAAGLFVFCSLCYSIYYFEIFWPVFRFGCYEYGLALVIIALEKLNALYQKKIA